MSAIKDRFSVRTFGMLVCAYIWLLIGIGGFQEISRTVPATFHLAIPGVIRGGIWVFSAAIAVVFAWSRRYSPLAIGLLFFMPTLQFVSYGIGWVIYKLPGGSPGNPSGWYSSALYLALVALVILIALIPSRAPTQEKGAE